MRILIACEYSGITRQAFTRMGHDVWSCDVLPTDQPGQHIQGDVLTVLADGWDMLIAHPPCTYLSYAGQRWFKTDASRWEKALTAFYFFMQMVDAPIPLIAIENPRGFTWEWYRKPDQVLHPFHFGHKEAKGTCLWLKGLQRLMATMVASDPICNWARNKGSHNGHARSKTFEGVAAAMADQWGH